MSKEQDEFEDLNKAESKENNINQAGLIKSDIDIQEFEEIIKDIIENPSVISLKEHLQHKHSSRYEHCYDVAYYTYVWCKRLGLDYISATRGAMLHDFYFYDWRNKGVEGQKKFHAYRHPRIALNNACENFELNELEKDIIVKHMWPLTISLPKYKESYIVTLVDKYCATKEFFSYYKYKKHLKNLSKINNKEKQDQK